MMTFRSLEKACKRRGYTVQHQVFDCGGTIRIHDGHILIAAVTRECGDSETETEVAAAWMLERGLLVLPDFDETIGAA